MSVGTTPTAARAPSATCRATRALVRGAISALPVRKAGD